MPPLDWQLAAEIATTISTIAFAASAIVVVLQLRQAARERYFSVTAHLFEIWQSPEFQHDQLFLLHKLSCVTWEEFCALGRGDHPERALHRVGGYYDRVGNLVRHGLIRKDDILPTIGGNAVAVWHRIEPLVKELRLRENAVLFENYESLLPECRECYVPGIESGVGTASMLTDSAISGKVTAVRATPEPSAAESRLRNGLHLDQSGLAPVALRKRSVTEMPAESRTIDARSPAMSELSMPDSDGIMHGLAEFTASGPAVLVYARGAYCPFCLRQLADYGERYRDFKQAGVEVFAISPESPRRSRRLRKQLGLPFTILSDSKLEVARNFGLMDHEKPGEPTPATLILDARHGVIMSTLNDWTKCVVARDALAFVRALKQGNDSTSIPAPQVDRPKPGGFLFVRGLLNMAAGLVIR
jgi:peroxiredoxin